MSYRTSYLDYFSLSYHHSNLELLSFLIKTLKNSVKITKNKRTHSPTPLLEKVDLELLEKTKNFLSAEKDKNPKNTSKNCKDSQTKVTSDINSMATREYITRNKAKGPYNYT